MRGGLTITHLDWRCLSGAVQFALCAGQDTALIQRANNENKRQDTCVEQVESSDLAWSEHTSEMQYRGDNFLYGGIDFSVPGEGGLDCINFLSPVQRLAETVVFGAVSLLLTVFYWRRVSLVTDNNNQAGGRDRELQVSRQCLLLSLSLVFGLELGYKLSTGQLLWVLNPCHVLTVTQLVLLVSPRSDLSLSLFRLQMYWLTGPLLAILFPVTFTRHIAGEVMSYWVQHLLLLVVPAHLLSTGRYTTEHLTDTAWPGLSLAVFSSYHWIVLQPAGESNCSVQTPL